MKFFTIPTLILLFSHSIFAQLVLERDINQEAASSRPIHFVELDGALYFKADDGIHGDELYKYDLDTEEAQLVADIRPYEAGTTISDLVAFNNKLYFNARDGFDDHLFVHDPTDNSTQRLTDSQGSQVIDPRSLTVFDDHLYFNADFPSEGAELGRYDPVSNTVELVADINLDGDSSPYALIEANGQLWFSANDGQSESRLWRYDPVTGLTENILYNNPQDDSPNVAPLYFFEGKIFFSGYVQSKGSEPWVYDINTNTLLELPEVYPGAGSSSPGEFIAYDGKLYFSARRLTEGRELWVYDPMTEDISLVVDIYPGFSNSGPSGYFVYNDKLYFSANVDDIERRLFSYSSSAGLMTEAAQDNNGQNNYLSVAILANDKIFLSARYEATGTELYQFIPGTEGITLAADINLTTIGSDPYGFTPYNGRLYFGATEINTGRNIWVYDPATGEVEILSNEAANIKPDHFTVLGDKLYFSGIDVDLGYGLLVYDDATGQISPTSYITPTSIGHITDVTAYHNKLYFKASDELLGRELHSYDPLTDQVEVVVDIHPTGSSSPEKYIVYNDELYFHADDGVNGKELWKYNDVTDEATLVVDINEGEDGSNPSWFVVFDDELYFSAYSPDVSTSLFSYNSVSETLTLRASVAGGLGPDYLTVYHDKLFFAGRFSSSVNYELLYYDPMTDELFLTEDLSPNSSSPRNMTVFNDKIYFATDTPEYGRELWEYNDTTLSIVADIRAGIPDSDPTYLTLFNDKLYFAADDGSRGSEIWSIAECLNVFIDTETQVELNGFGAIELNIQGGTPPYSVIWNTGDETERIENLQAGMYSAIITDASGCLSEIDAEVDFFSQTEAILSSDLVSLSPNPNQGDFIVNAEGLNAESIEIFDMKGRLVYQQILSDQMTQFNVHLQYAPAGIYVLKLTAEEGVVSKRFVRE